MKTVTVAFLIALGTGSVMAQEELARAQNCWSLMPEHFGIGATVDLEVEIQKGVVQSVDVVSYSPDTEVGYAIATAAVRSVEVCGPYGDLTETAEMTFQVDAPPAATSSIPLPGKQ